MFLLSGQGTNTTKPLNMVLDSVIGSSLDNDLVNGR